MGRSEPQCLLWRFFRPWKATCHAEQVLVSGQDLRLGLGPAELLAGMGRLCCVRRAYDRWILCLSSPRNTFWLWRIRCRALGAASSSVLVQGGAATVAMGQLR